MRKLELNEILQNGFKTGMKNFVPLLLTSILYSITLWIPYINVGTTIAIITIPTKISKGEVINPTEIFNAKYRENMGNFFLVVGFQMLIIGAGYLFFIIPGIIMAYTYMFATLLVIDKGVNPLEALNMSNKMTNGNKLIIFFTYVIIGIPMCIPIVNFIYSFVYFAIVVSVTGYLYGALLPNLEEPKIDEQNETLLIEGHTVN